MTPVAPRVRPYHSERRAARARDTRGRVLEAATKIFLECGYGAATIRAVAREAGVSMPLVELLFGSKARLLKAAIDVAIAGDDEPVAMLDRAWAAAARQARTAKEFLNHVARAVATSQSRSAGLGLAVFEGAARDAHLALLREQMTAQRAVMAAWIVHGLGRLTPLRDSEAEAVDAMWILMDPAVFDRLTRQRGWSVERYQAWFAQSAARLLTGGDSTHAWPD